MSGGSGATVRKVLAETAGSGGAQSSGGGSWEHWGIDGEFGDIGRGWRDCGREGRARQVHKERRVTLWDHRQQGGLSLELWSSGESDTRKRVGEIVDSAGGAVHKEGRATWW